MPNTKGSGEAYQSWNSDQATATQSRICAAMPRRLAAAGIGFGDELLRDSTFAVAALPFVSS